MMGFFITNLLSIEFWFRYPLLALLSVFQLWMLVDALRRREWVWALFIAIGWGISALLYFFLVFRAAPSTTRGFELPGAHDRRRIKELQAQIHHLDKAHHHSQLGDIYFQQGKLDSSEACYRAALQRDPQDIDTRAHLGQCLLRQNKAGEARPLLEGVVSENPKHDYGHTMMALAEALRAQGDTQGAMAMWKQVTESHSYPRAKVQLAELYAADQKPDLARAELMDVVADDEHAPAFQRSRDRIWVRRAQRLLRTLPQA
ncbi:MAG TPA: tetratricopeptide repeat protein [Verrucomicrobiae bacterium]|nr:tetratricopeptide repeat protein [Verrucomicrobiae bacterium]